MAVTQSSNDNRMPEKKPFGRAGEMSREQAEEVVRSRRRYKMARRARESKRSSAMPRIVAVRSQE
jgi:hypothetical protein